MSPEELIEEIKIALDSVNKYLKNNHKGAAIVHIAHITKLNEELYKDVLKEINTEYYYPSN